MPWYFAPGLYGWAFNVSSRGRVPPVEVVTALAWIEKHSLPLREVVNPVAVRRVLDACAVNLNGRAAAATTMRRKRAVTYNALGYAVELGLIEANPIDKVQWRAAKVAHTVDRRVVANPAQVRAWLSAVRDQGQLGERFEAFFGCLYFAAMRPSEALALRVADCYLPDSGWGRITFGESEPDGGAQWTDGGTVRETRGLKRRGEDEARSVPIPPELVTLLRDHVERFGRADDGRLFYSPRHGGVSASTYGRVWHRARQRALTAEHVRSPLAARPYDLRHAAVSLWLNSGVPATEVARRAGHSVAVLLAVYANCVDGQEPTFNDRIEAALGLADAVGESAGGPLTGQTASMQDR